MLVRIREIYRQAYGYRKFKGITGQREKDSRIHPEGMDFDTKKDKYSQ